MQTNKLNSVLILVYKVFKEVILSFLNLNIDIPFYFDPCRIIKCMIKNIYLERSYFFYLLCITFVIRKLSLLEDKSSKFSKFKNI